MTAPRPETRMAAMILEEPDFHHTACLFWSRSEPCDCTLPLRLAEIEAEARAPLVEALRRLVDEYDEDMLRTPSFVSIAAARALLAGPDAAPRPDYESRVTAMADALHEDCRLEWQAIGAVGREATVTQHGADAHYGKAHALVRRLWPELDTASGPAAGTGDAAALRWHVEAAIEWVDDMIASFRATGEEPTALTEVASLLRDGLAGKPAGLTAKGYTPPFYGTLIPAASPLDAAWAEVERALPEGWKVSLYPQVPPGDPWAAIANVPGRPLLNDSPGKYIAYHGGPTPVAALNALAAALARRLTGDPAE